MDFNAAMLEVPISAIDQLWCKQTQFLKGVKAILPFQLIIYLLPNLCHGIASITVNLYDLVVVIFTCFL